MQKLKLAIITLMLLTTANCAAELLRGHYQLLMVKTANWEEQHGCLQRYERENDHSDWKMVGEAIPVSLGKAGLAWGIGLHPNLIGCLSNKKEGDMKAPAGVFSLGTAFGFAEPDQVTDLKLDYLHIDDFTEAVDDPASRYYNQIVNTKNIVNCDWYSSEKMSNYACYHFGIVVNHNFPNPKPGAGSAIFMHIWSNDIPSYTCGCTSMSKKNMVTLLSWLEQDKNPVLVQLPVHAYDQMRPIWFLP